MYEPFFGLTGEPFAVAPDPRFMYLSPAHREALIHMELGLRGAGGFVLLTGEIGAGKTTVWRSFLEHMPPNFDVAAVVNPRLGVDALLARLCADLGVATSDPPDGDPIDALHGHLLLAHAQGRRTLIAVDEAQALSDEALEQLRLLTNLVTADRKLLQVLLIGQPELLDMLERPVLEPLAQRVVARFHLPALSERETRLYIAHRLAVAGAGGPLPFDDAALARIHAHVGGVPRRINVLCDRLLHAAWEARQRRVDAALVDRVAQDVFGRRVRPSPAAAHDMASAVPEAPMVPAAGPTPAPDRARDAAPPAATSAAPAPAAPANPASPPQTPAVAPATGKGVWLLAGVGLAAGMLLSPLLRDWVAGPVPAPALAVNGSDQDASLATASLPTVPPPAAEPEPAPVPEPAARSDLDDLFSARGGAAAADAAAWQVMGALFGVELAPGDPCAQATAQGLACFGGEGGIAQIRQLDRPAVLQLTDAFGRQASVVLVGIGAGSASLRVGDETRSVPLDRLARDWRGGLVTVWQPPPGYRSGQIVTDDDGALARWVAERLPPAAAGAPRSLTERVLAFQLAHGLDPDGLAGAQTLMALNRAAGAGSPAAPRLHTP